MPWGGIDRLSLEGLVRTLTLTHGWSVPVMRTWNVASWSISCEWAAYISFPVFAAAALRLNSPRWIAFVLALLFALLSCAIYAGDHAGSMAYGLVRIAVEFPAGVLLHRLWSLRSGPSRIWNHVAAAALVTMLIVGSALALRDSRAPLLWMPALACFIVYGLASGEGALVRWLSRPLAIYAGRISYAFYMVHLIVISAIAQILIVRFALGDELLVAGSVFGSLVLSVLLAHWLYISIEQPARSWMLRRQWFALRRERNHGVSEFA